MPEPKPSIFLSYGRGDDDEDYNDPEKSFLRKLYNDLTQAGYDVWWDRESMPARGLTFLQEIQDAITEYDKLILVVGPYGMNSDYVRAEWEHAHYLCKPMIPILLKSHSEEDKKSNPKLTDYDLIPEPLRNFNAPSFVGWQDDPTIYDTTLKDLTRILADEQPDPATTYNLPQLSRGYIERDEFSNVRDALLSDAISPTVTREENQTIFIQGSGGIGKSTIASALGRLCEIRRRYDDGVIWVTLGKNPIIAQKQGDIGVLFDDDRENYQDSDTGKMHLKRILANKHALIILDDVWSHKDVQAFMALGARCRMLVTTRDYRLALKIHGHEYDIEKLTEPEGLNLLGKWQKRDPEADNPHETTEREIVNLLDGYTLAVALVGAKLANKRPAISHEDLLARLQEGHTFQDLQIDDEDKDYNLEKSLYVSYVDLTEDDQKRFRQLGVLAPNADFDVNLISAIWEDDEQSTQGALNRLVESALLNTTESGRWVQHSVLRAYALALMSDNQQKTTFSDYIAYVTELGSQTKRLPMQDWNSQIGPDYPHIDYLGDTLTAYYSKNLDSYHNMTGDFIWAVQRYVTDRPVMRDTAQGRQRRGLDWLKIGAKLYGELDQKPRQATTLNNIGKVYHSLGQMEKGLAYYEEALPILRDVGDRDVEGTTLNNIGAVYQSLGQMEKGLAYYEEALPIFREMGDRSSEGNTLNNIGLVYDTVEDKSQALDYYQRALPILRDVENRSVEATTLNNIGEVYRSLGQMEKGLAYYEEALPIFREVGDRGGEGTALNNIGVVYDAIGDKSQALDYYQQALPIRREVGNRSGEGNTLNNIGAVYDAVGDKGQALGYYQQALPILRDVGNRSVEATTLNNIGVIYFQQGNLEKAAQILIQIAIVFEQIGAVAEQAGTYVNLGVTYNKMGRVADAILQVEQAITLLQSKGLTRDAGGHTLDQKQALLAQLKGENPPSQNNNPLMKSIKRLFGRK